MGKNNWLRLIPGLLLTVTGLLVLFVPPSLTRCSGGTVPEGCMGAWNVVFWSSIVGPFIILIGVIVLGLSIHSKHKSPNEKPHDEYGLKCSDCKLWKTEECRNNPAAKNFNYADTFACFVPQKQGK